MKKVIKNKLFVGGILLLLAAKSALAADTMMSSEQTTNNDRIDFYRANELSVDVFGSASLGKYSIEHPSNSRIRHNTRLGAGMGLSYFITRNLGVGAEAYSENTSGPFIDSASANVTLRFPLGESGLAPYAFGGGGRQFELAKAWFAQAGGGLEYRFTRHMGAFVDARFVLPNETKGYGVGRLGVRFAF